MKGRYQGLCKMKIKLNYSTKQGRNIAASILFYTWKNWLKLISYFTVEKCELNSVKKKTENISGIDLIKMERGRGWQSLSKLSITNLSNRTVSKH